MGLGHIFFTAANAVLPILLLIVLGILLRNAGWVSESFLKTGNKLVFNIFLPAMLFINVYTQNYYTESWLFVIHKSH